MTCSRILRGDCGTLMTTLPRESVDAIVTDPPYELGFMGKSWDRSGIAFRSETWEAALRIAKPGAHLVAFGGTRTHHRMMVAIEDAGWEIRDCLSWLYGSGFPKSHNGPWGGTALKPAWEPIILARKPLSGTVAANVQAHGTGALNIDGCRISTDGERLQGSTVRDDIRGGRFAAGHAPNPGDIPDYQQHAAGRWPANVTLDEAAAAMLGEPSRFFYCAKASRKERNAGLGEGRNPHPTVKPLALMRWLVRLVTPPDGLILDPFTGSGTTGMAAMAEGFRFLGIELSEDYAEIARRRIASVG